MKRSEMFHIYLHIIIINNQVSVGCSPEPAHEKCLLIQKLTSCVEKRFSNDRDVTKTFLDLAYLILRFLVDNLLVLKPS